MEVINWAQEIVRDLEASGIEWGDIYWAITDVEDRERTEREVNSGCADFWVKKDGVWILFIADERTGEWSFQIEQ